MKKATLAIAIFSIACIIIGGVLSMLFWRYNFVYSFDSDVVYSIGEVDFSDFVNYSMVTNTFVIGACMTFLGAFSGAAFASLVWFIYGIVLLNIVIINKAKDKKSAKHKKSVKKGDAANG